MENMVNIVHNDYDKISDLIFWFNKEWVLKFNVKLNRFDSNRGRINFHNEYGYNTSNGYCVSINRDYKYYFTIETTKRDSDGYKDQVAITVNDFYFLKFKLNNALKWFTGNESVFAKKEDGMIVVPSKTYMEKLQLRNDSYIEIEPSVVRYGADQYIGVRLYLGNDATNFFMDVSTFIAFVDLINNYNMVLSAQTMLAYFGMNEYGINYKQFGQVSRTSNNDRGKVHRFLNQDNNKENS